MAKPFYTLLTAILSLTAVFADFHPNRMTMRTFKPRPVQCDSYSPIEVDWADISHGTEFYNVATNP